MKKEILEELADRWERDSRPPEAVPDDGSEQTAVENAMKQGVRAGKRECAADLRTLIGLLG